MMKRTAWGSLLTRLLSRRDGDPGPMGYERYARAGLQKRWMLQRALALLILLWAVFGTPGGVLAHTARISASPEKHPSTRSNLFPYPQCTWWANERYHQLHGSYVPWTTQADAWQWKDRANEFGWHVSDMPQQAGSILVLQPWTQGAYGLGHVAVVERILPSGHVIASNMNWAAHPTTVTNVEFAPGPGVSFIDQTSL